MQPNVQHMNEQWRRGEGSVATGIERLARVGYATKGLVYVTLGVLSIQAAVSGGSPEGSQGAIRALGQQTFGTVLLWIIAVGMAAYGLWRLVQAAVDPEHIGTDAKGIAKRIAYTISGLTHGALAVLAFQLATGSGSGGGSSKQTYVAQLMGSTAGQILVGAAGVAVIAFGLHQLYKAKTSKVGEQLKTGEMSGREQRAAVVSGRAGLAARGAVFAVIGTMLVQAAIQTDPSEVKGVGGALGEIASSTWGTVLLFIVALGLVLYGAYQFVLARYRRFET